MAVAINTAVKLPHFEGWHLVGAFPDNEPDDVGSWLLVDNGEALLLEIPEGLAVQDVTDALDQLEATLQYVTASHDHEDHLDLKAWDALVASFPHAKFLHPSGVKGDLELGIGDEPVWLIKGPKHSLTDVVTVFRGVAMTGDIELGTLATVNDEVPLRTKKASMDWLGGFQERADYHVHTVFSAHLNDVRTSIWWPDLFRYEEAKAKRAIRTQCRRYGCGGNLVPMPRDSVGFDMKCEECGCPDWSDLRKK